jgi:hypothetical protein
VSVAVYRDRVVSPRTATGFVALSIVLALAGGCAHSTTPDDGGSDSGAVDAATVVDAAAIDGGGCDVAPVPDALPSIEGSFATVDPDASMTPPVLTGGDPRGVWVFDSGTFWVDRAAATMFNPFASSVGGTAWIAIDDTTFRLDYELITMLAQTEAGTIVQSTSTRVHARYRVDREQLEPTGLVCSESNQDMTGDSGRITFTVVGDHITLSTEVPASTGPLVIVLEGTRRP